MDAAGWIVAGYAALVSTASLTWQVVSWRLARKSRVEVTVNAAMLPYDDGRVLDGVTVNVVNNSDHAVRVTSAGLVLTDGSNRDLVQMSTPSGATLPGLIAPHDSAMTYFLVEDLERETDGIDIYAPLAGWVQLATGERVKSKPRVTRTR